MDSASVDKSAFIQKFFNINVNAAIDLAKFFKVILLFLSHFFYYLNLQWFQNLIKPIVHCLGTHYIIIFAFIFFRKRKH